jgi:guanosine-3',5'-bis(diphosphate) 3'-pyrophosphohydrolase
VTIPGDEVAVIHISEILESIRGYAPDADLEVVMQAYLLAAKAHAGQTRKSGEPYLSHPMAVAQILTEMKMDVDTIATALLHDALEDNPITKAEMSAQVGPVVTELVDGVTKIGKLKYRSKEELQAENFRKMMLAMSRDVRVILVKLADRLHNMRTLDGHKPEKRQSISAETMEVYAPIANRLGLAKLRTELEDLCFMHLDPPVFETVTSFLERTAKDRQVYVKEVASLLQHELDAASVSGRVSGRVKAPSSIWRKMVKQGHRVEDVPDILAFRLIVADVGACYTMLGLLHAKFAPIPGRIKDYIARAKANGYRSLHTTVCGPGNKRIEVQIRTQEMHDVAERGIAAHWRYKEGHLALSPEDVVKISRIREAFEGVNDTESASEFMESVKVAFYADEVFVFTPTGEVKRLPLGSTALDFAFAIHSDVGSTCTGARVDGRIVPLDYALRSGEAVEILTNANQRPSRDWLKIAHTSRAISRIRRYLRQAEEDSALKMGRDLVEGELGRFEWNLARAKSEGRLETYLRGRSEKTLDAVLVQVGLGHLPPSEVAKGSLPEGVWYSRQEEASRNRLASLFNRFTGQRARSPVLITGEDGLLVSYAGCCNPLPGEEVVGFITRGRGITVHRADCATLVQLDEDRRVAVDWDLGSPAKHSNTLAIHCLDRPGLLASITRVCEQAKVNIERAEALTSPASGGVVRLQLAVADLAELTRVIRNIEKIAGVDHVERVAS